MFGFRQRLIIASGVDSRQFANLRLLVASWRRHMRAFPLCVCDYGMTAGERQELVERQVRVLAPPVSINHPWQGKSLIGRFLAAAGVRWDVLMWIDADALFLRPLPDVPPLLRGYDLLLDAHIMSVGEVAHECNRTALGLRRDDAYFSAGWWVARRGCLLRDYERFCRLVQGQGNLWEGDAFVAAIYHARLKIRTVNGGVWHARGRTSLPSCTVDGTEAFHAGQPIYVLHANDYYTTRADNRRVFVRPELAAIQDHYEEVYRRAPSE